jgi:hypothetical protein
MDCRRFRARAGRYRAGRERQVIAATPDATEALADPGAEAKLRNSRAPPPNQFGSRKTAAVRGGTVTAPVLALYDEVLTTGSAPWTCAGCRFSRRPA